MSIHNKIVVVSPYGRQTEGIISGTPKPGTAMQIQAGTEPIGGRLTWEVFNGTADGERTLMAILTENWKLGKTPTDAYVTGEYGFLWFPQPGDEIQVLLENQSGTADSFAIGDKLIVDDGTGKFLATGTSESEPFIVMETLAALTADALVLAYATGS